MSSLLWKLNRVRRMGAPELAWRIAQVWQRQFEKRGFGLATTAPQPTAAAAGWPALHPDTLDPTEKKAVVAQADALLRGEWRVFAMEDLALGLPPIWNRCPKTGVQAPMAHGTAIDYRREDLVGDIKYLWEPSRHLEVPVLAMAWSVTGDARYAMAARTLVASWIEQCPYPNGVHWASSLELAIRLLNWAVAWPLLDSPGAPTFAGDAGQRFQADWLRSVYQHADFIARHLSKHSSANNHLFGELMGLFVAALRWPCWPESEGWRRFSQDGLEQQAQVQNAADGVNLEQAIYYHHEVMDMMLLCDRFAQVAGHPFSPAFAGRLQAMAGFVHALMDRGGQVPMIGDADDATMLRLEAAAHATPYASLLASSAIRFGDAGFKAKAGVLDQKTRLLFGQAGVDRWKLIADAQPDQPRLAFPAGGYYLLGEHFGADDEVRAVIDCGPLGYLSIAAHGHADALAFTLSLGGDEVLVDPGTFCYHTQERWRNHFRSTAAHNTVNIDGLDQSVIGGNFMWMQHAPSQLERHDTDGPVQTFAGRHGGYQRLPDPVTHRRKVELARGERRLQVTDTLECQAQHTVGIHWQLAEQCTVQLVDGAAEVRCGRWRVTIACGHAGLRPTVLRGSDQPPGGWISRRFDSKQPADQLRWTGEISGTTEILTLISWQAIDTGFET